MIRFFTVAGGGRLSSCVGGCLWLLEELNRPYEIVEIDIPKGQHKSTSFLALNPNGKIPCLSDDSFVIWESVAINYYLAGKYKPELLGSNLKERGLIDQWILWSVSELQPSINAIFTNAMKSPEERDRTLMQACKYKILQHTVLVDKYLKDKKFLVAEKFTLADLHLSSYMHIHSTLHTELSNYHFFKRWYLTMMQSNTLTALEKKKLLVLSH